MWRNYSTCQSGRRRPARREVCAKPFSSAAHATRRPMLNSGWAAQVLERKRKRMQKRLKLLKTTKSVCLGFVESFLSLSPGCTIRVERTRYHKKVQVFKAHQNLFRFYSTRIHLIFQSHYSSVLKLLSSAQLEINIFNDPTSNST